MGLMGLTGLMGLRIARRIRTPPPAILTGCGMFHAEDHPGLASLAKVLLLQ
jgi:hypothetical protein